MFCEKCGAECREGAKYCPKCGAPLGPERLNNEEVTPSEDVASVSDKNGENRSLKKRRTVLIILIVVIIAALAVIVTALVVRHSPKWIASAIEEHLESGNRYLEEDDYEEAVAEFAAILKIEPNMQAYYYLADTYLKMSETDDSSRIQEKFADNIYEGTAHEVYVTLANDVYEAAVELALDDYEQTGELPEYSEELFDAALIYRANHDDVEGLSDLSKAISLSANETGKTNPYFKNHYLEIEPTGSLMYYTRQTQGDGSEDVFGWVKEDVSIEMIPSDESGYADTTIRYFNSDIEFGGSYESAIYLFDYYTGEQYLSMDTLRETGNGSNYDYAVTLLGESGELFDIYFSKEPQQDDSGEWTLTVHHPEEYDGTVFAFVGFDSDVTTGYTSVLNDESTIDENGYDIETGDRVAIMNMANSGEWVWADNRSSLSRGDLSKFDIHFLREGVESATPWFVASGLEVTPLDTTEQKISVDIVADDGTPGTATLSIALDSQNSFKSSWAGKDEYSLYKNDNVRFKITNVNFGDGTYTYTYYWSFYDYYTGDGFGTYNPTDQDGTDISERASFTTWNGKSFNYWVENTGNAWESTANNSLCCPDWYDGTVFYICFRPDDSFENGLFFKLE